MKLVKNKKKFKELLFLASLALLVFSCNMGTPSLPQAADVAIDPDLVIQADAPVSASTLIASLQINAKESVEFYESEDGTLETIGSFQSLDRIAEIQGLSALEIYEKYSAEAPKALIAAYERIADAQVQTVESEFVEKGMDDGNDSTSKMSAADFIANYCGAVNNYEFSGVYTNRTGNSTYIRHCTYWRSYVHPYRGNLTLTSSYRYSTTADWTVKRVISVAEGAVQYYAIASVNRMYFRYAITDAENDGLHRVFMGNYCQTPNYEPTYWNSNSTIRSKNNCYNYGCNKRTDTFAQPGRGSGQRWTVITKDEIIKRAKQDGLEYRNMDSSAPPKTKSLVALVVGANVDYHWYRLDRNGYWSHKPGGTNATNVDNSGNTITDPSKANWGTYYNQFCGYFLVDSSYDQGVGLENIN